MRTKALLLLLLVIALALVIFLPEHAIPLAAQGPNGPQIGKEIKHDTSPPLREIAPAPLPPVTGIREQPEPEETNHIKARPQIKDPVRQRRFAPTNSPLAIPSAAQNFD